MKKHLIIYISIFTFSLISFGFGTSKEAEKFYLLGESAFKERKYISALNYYRKSLKSNPYYKEAKIGMGKSFFELKNYEKALKYFKIAESKFKSDFNIKIWLAKVQVERKKFDSAESYIQKAFQLKPRDIDVHIIYGDIFFERKNYEKAIQHYKEALEISPNDNLAFLKIGRSYLYLEKLPKALSHLQKAEEIDNKNHLTNYYLGEYYFKQNDLLTSEKYLKTAVLLSPSSIPAMNILYQVLYKMEKWEESKDILEKLNSLHQNNKTYLYHLGLAYEKVKQPKKSLSLLMDAIKLDLGDEAIRFQAEMIFHKYYWTNKNIRKTGQELAKYWYKKGKNYLRQNLTDFAVFSFRRGIRLDPNHWQMRFELAEIYKSKRLIHKYYDEMKIIKSLNPNNQDINDRFLFASRALRNILSKKEGIEQYNETKTKPKLALLYFKKNKDFKHHYGAENLFREIFYTTLKMKDRLNVVMVEEKKDFKNEEEIAKDENADFIITGEVQENKSEIQISIKISFLDGEIYKTLDITQRGSDRILSSAMYLSDRMVKFFPVFAQIIRKNHKEVFVNIGKIHGYKQGDRFYVIRSNKALKSLITNKNLNKVMENRDLLSQILLSFTKDKQFGLEEIKITKVDENISKGQIVTSDFFDEVTINNYVIFKPR
ncbi:MAG: tetratricopeptide repeat protein [Spirochaetota bacterium]|nr:tetratricopeptide repeat protein [Spirochaetota bacterium]